MTNEQVDQMEEDLRKAQALVESAGATVCGEASSEGSSTWYRLNEISEDIADLIRRLFVLRPVEDSPED